ncbi:hypothetical protein A2230_08240 [candidate division WOR-1 bacterium RIFOXYA2_FULL_36_21]|uniref:Uncharacterized protein n=1 Tax=candidate division WOR-1 bacterium RIFOXYB2_FULL_36_35 TaxID=1802578 RepID=A0A1F4S866_UNCSA|nr:MAG: hypothetical protein A2230_08240 [candidate division WOR-1 bacterium RIFOXYA2_FULL_36_21]OGC14630.1 MAG: hypothetical protein A2282_04255 [candidate division WOR-1 bacterium RIFOXYA12_FULL_36_13]OGC16645.1 MAG: hypothetical protein A2290_03455 [candidate division WOR-1 bacterium RIFOXYB2_FULL_36_35]
MESYKKTNKPRILNIVPISIGSGEVSLGPLYISSALKKAGFDSVVFFPDLSLIMHFPIKYDFIQHQLDYIMKQIRPEVVTFSVLSTNYNLSKSWAEYIKTNFNTTHIIFGGIHSMIEGENIIKLDYVDAVCLGEGEFSLPQYLELILNNKLTQENSLNITYKLKGKIINSKKEQVFLSLDEYPFPDREPLKYYYREGVLDSANFITGRGCPYNCFYCNAAMLNQNKGYLRFRSPGNVIDEIIEVKAKFELKKVIFSDETFTMNKNNLFKLLELYKSKVNLPFECQTRVEAINDDIAKELTNSGCESITLGIESGNEYIREKYLNRKMKNDQIIKAFHILKKYNIRTNSFNMIGLPGDTEKTIWEGIDLNIKAKVDSAACTIFMPFKKTPIFEWYQDKKLIIAEPNTNYYENIVIKHPNLSKLSLFFYSLNFNTLIKLESNKFKRMFKVFLWVKLFFLLFKGFLLKLIKNPLKLIAMNTFMKNYYGRLSVKGIIE